MKAIIRVTRRTEYASIVEMTQEEYDRLDAALEAGGSVGRKAEKELNEMIDVHDWQDDELDDLREFAPFVEEGEGEKP